MTHLSNLSPLNNEFLLWPVYRLDNLRLDFCQGRDSSLFQNIHTTSGAQPVSYSRGTGNYFPQSKSGWLGYEAGHSYACSSEVKVQYTSTLTIRLHGVQRDITFNNLYITCENNHYRNVLVHYTTTLHYSAVLYNITLLHSFSCDPAVF